MRKEAMQQIARQLEVDILPLRTLQDLPIPDVTSLLNEMIWNGWLEKILCRAEHPPVVLESVYAVRLTEKGRAHFGIPPL